MKYRTILLLTGALFLAGCQYLPFRQEPEPESPPQPETGQLDAADSVTDPLSQAIIYLQEGEAEAAELLLEAIVADNSDHQLANQLLEQIRQPPEALLGAEYTEITVQPGDTLSGIAAEHLGDGLMFFALARYNDIARPRLLSPGDVLKVPAPYDAEETPETESATAEELQRITAPVMETTDSRLVENAVEQMVSRGYYDQAYELLLTIPEPDDLAPEASAALAEHYHDLALKAWRDQQVDDAAGLWRKVLRVDPEFEPAQIYLERAESLLERLQELDTASG